jgi:hypothetical protein
LKNSGFAQNQIEALFRELGIPGFGIKEDGTVTGGSIAGGFALPSAGPTIAEQEKLATGAEEAIASGEVPSIFTE